MWAVLLGVLLVVVAATTSHAAMNRPRVGVQQAGAGARQVAIGGAPGATRFG